MRKSYDEKMLSIILALTLTVSLAACGGETATAPDEPAVSEKVIPELNMDELTFPVITTEAGEYVPVATAFTDIPEEFHTECARPGTFIREDYTTDLYYGGETIKKHLQVVRPYERPLRRLR